MNRFKTMLSFSLLVLTVVILASCDEKDDTKDFEVKTETNISYTITMSPDLLKFVTPQVLYVDENGNIVTLTGVEDLDGKVIESKAEIKDGDSYASAWSSQVIKGTGYKCWTIQRKFNRLNFHSLEMTLLKIQRVKYTTFITTSILASISLKALDIQ